MVEPATPMRHIHTTDVLEPIPIFFVVLATCHPLAEVRGLLLLQLTRNDLGANNLCRSPNGYVGRLKLEFQSKLDRARSAQLIERIEGTPTQPKSSAQTLPEHLG